MTNHLFNSLDLSYGKGHWEQVCPTEAMSRQEMATYQ